MVTKPWQINAEPSNLAPLKPFTVYSAFMDVARAAVPISVICTLQMPVCRRISLSLILSVAVLQVLNYREIQLVTLADACTIPAQRSMIPFETFEAKIRIRMIRLHMYVTVCSSPSSALGLRADIFVRDTVFLFL